MLPRKVPWVPGELEYVFELVFVSSNPLDHTLGLRRMKTWISRSCCPHAVESTASLLDMIVLDNSKSSPANAFQLRLGYAMAIVRMVNGLVDPAQQGIYARSIAAIAHELGLPLSFVEIRHAATHEDLPSLTLLRQGARNALDWLYEHYWLYQVHNNQSFDSPDKTSPSSYAQLPTLLKTYKTLQKELLRDSLDDQEQIANIQTQIENAILVKSSSADDPSRTSVETSFAGIDATITVLLQPGYLVPLKRKKRTSSRSKKLSPDLISIWIPFLHWLENIYETTLETLVYRILDSILLVDKSHTTLSSDMSTYYYTLCAWMIQITKEIDDNTSILKNIARGCLLCPNPFSLRVLEDVSDNNIENSFSLTPLVNLLSKDQRRKNALPESQVTNAITNIDSHLQEMESRLTSLAQKPPEAASLSASVPMEDIDSSSSNWRMHDSNTWASCPIGCLPDRSTPSFTPASVFG